MARMVDTTPIAEGDVVLARREARGFVPQDEGRVTLTTEERMEKRRARYEAAKPVALEILEAARQALAVRFRFLDQALWRMPLIPSFDIYGIASDGKCVLFDPVYVVERFEISFNEVVRDMIHCLFHCIFRHPFMLYSVLRQPWDVACDIAIEAIILELVGDAFPSNMDRRAKEALKVLSAHVGGVVTAERLYWFFCNEGNKTDLKSLAPMFFHDAHGLWYGEEENADQQARSSESKDTGLHEDAPPTQGSETETIDSIADGPVEVPMPRTSEAQESSEAEEESVHGEGEGASASENDGSSPSDPLEDSLEKEELAREWEDVSRRIQAELESRLIRQGEGAGSMIAALTAVNREVSDYSEFLKRFATLHEAMRVNDDEFDYIYYKLGLDRYGNMPLIEPLEYKEDHRVHDFVIAIDTSESCSGEMVKSFLSKTYSILKNTDSFHDRVNIHIVQCDAKIQKDTRITSLDQLDSYLDEYEICGFGGTDFRPVFDYVDLLIEKGEFTDLRGLVYFTDGEGVFPRRAPAYDAVFAFLDDGYSDPSVPPWAFKTIIDRNELLEEKG